MSGLRWAATSWYGGLCGLASVGVHYLGGLTWQLLFLLPAFAGGVLLSLTWQGKP